jgi:hypothetical protein
MLSKCSPDENEFMFMKLEPLWTEGLFWEFRFRKRSLTFASWEPARRQDVLIVQNSCYFLQLPPLLERFESLNPEHVTAQLFLRIMSNTSVDYHLMKWGEAELCWKLALTRNAAIQKKPDRRVVWWENERSLEGDKHIFVHNTKYR